MLENWRLGAALVIIGVLANNYVYLHDLVFGSQQGVIELGWLAGAGIVVTLAVIAVGLVILLRSRESDAAN